MCGFRGFLCTHYDVCVGLEVFFVNIMMCVCVGLEVFFVRVKSVPLSQNEIVTVI